MVILTREPRLVTVQRLLFLFLPGGVDFLVSAIVDEAAVEFLILELALHAEDVAVIGTDLFQDNVLRAHPLRVRFQLMAVGERSIVAPFALGILYRSLADLFLLQLRKWLFNVPELTNDSSLLEPIPFSHLLC